MRPILSKLRLPKLGTLALSIPVVTLGEGRPLLTLVTGIHGDETSGLFVVDRLLRRLTTRRFDGQLQIFPSANPLAQALNLRAAPRDALDLNRIFPGDPDGSLSHRIAHQLFERFSASDLVIDFHSFDLRNPVLAVFSNCGCAKARARSLALIDAFGPVLTWQLDVERGGDRMYEGALGAILHRAGVANFGVELPTNHRLTSDEIDASVEGVLAVMVELGMLGGSSRPKRPVPLVRREEHLSPASGLFRPTREIMTEVAGGAVIGRLTSITTFEDTPIVAPAPGKLLQIHDRAFVVTGASIFTMCYPIEAGLQT